MMADSKYIQHTRRSPYLESLLIPAVGPRPIPDDVMKEHTDKPETTTYNISSPASGSGLFVFYPNNGTGLVGTHYIFSGGNYVYDNTTGPLVTAQNLYQNYNYGRLISQIITTKSSTLPAGVYALNGTINTINIYNTLSEVSGGLTYNNILSLNNNITDKVGNVLVGDGVATLSLPQTFNKPFVRFNDPTPFSLGNGVTASLNPVMIDDNNSQVCMSTLAMSIPKTTNTTVSTINIDSTTPMMISGTVNYTVATAAADGCVQITLVFLDAFAGVISTKVVFRTIGLNAGIYTQPFSFNYTGSYYTDNTQPVGAVQVQISQTSGAAMLMSLNLAIRPLGANNPGANQPIALVAYQGVATGSQITLSGITNYELIPNSNLKKNVKTEYGHYDPAEFDYVKRILQNKDQFGIRSVYSLPDYNRAKETFRDLYLLDSEVIARSFSWNKLLKIIKDIVLKGTAAAFPMSRPVIDVVDDFANNNIDRYVRSAGGTPVVGAVRSAGGLPVAMAKNQIKMFARAADTFGLETPEDSDDEPLDFSLPFSELTNRLAKCHSIGAEIIEKNPDSLIEKAVFNVKAKMTSLGFIPMDKYPSQLGTVVARELCDILESLNDAIHSGLQPLDKFRMLHAKGMLINTISLAKGDHSIIEENQGLMDFLNKHPLEGSKVAEVVARSMESELISLRDQGIISNDELDSFVVRRDTPNINLDEEILKNSSGDTILDLYASNTVGALFPVLLTEGTRTVGCMLYIAVKGDYSMYLPEAARGHYTLSINGYKIHGLMNDKFNLNILSDVTLLPVTEVRGNRVSVAQVGFVVVESSCYGAIASVQLANWIGVKGVAITGNVIRASYPSYDVPVAQELINSVLMPNPVSYIKREYLASIGLQMIESTENASYAMRAVIQLMSSYPQAEVVAKVRALDSVEELSMAILDKIATVARSMDTNFDDLPPPPPELLAPLAEEEPYGFELPPPVVSDTMQVKEVWDEATAVLSESDQVFKEGIEVLNWLYKNKLVTTMGEYIRTDPDGSRFRRMMVNYVTNVEGVVRLTANPTAADAQRAKAERISASLQPQYPDITASWVIKNGYRGPSTEQARYFRANRRLPEPGYTPIDALGDKVEAIVLNVLKGFKNATQAQEEALRSLVRDVQRGPKPDELHTIFGVGRGDLERVIDNTISNNRLNSEEAAAARAKIMEKGSGLTSEELAGIRGRQVRNRSRLEPLAPAAPIYTTPGPTRGRLARMLATNTELV